MKPLQVWLPMLRSSLCSPEETGDLHRAMHAWRGEMTVWLLPELEKTVRWQEDPVKHLVAVPSEHLERVDVHNVGPNGYVVGRNSGIVFPGGRVDGLLDAWLNVQKLGLVLAPHSIILTDVPEIHDSEVVYGRRELQFAPYGSLPLTLADGQEGKFSCRWPPESVHYDGISPDAESEEMYGPFDPIVSDGLPMGVGQKTGRVSLWVTARWPDPFRSLVPAGDGADVFAGLCRMQAIAKQSSQDPFGALTRAREAASAYVFGGYTSRRWSWFWPTYAAGKEDAVLCGAEDFGVKARSFDELSKDDLFSRRMAERVQIRRAWGPLGLFWALLLDRLEGQVRLHSCGRCHRIIEGRKGKKYCSKSDSPECFRERRAADKQRSRQRG
jgi:hypothetical protein